MPVITRAVAGKRDPTRVNLFIDGKFALSLSADEFISRHLARGIELTAEQLEELKKLGGNEKLFGKILNFISYRPRSVREVVDRLKKYDADPIEIPTLIDKLKDLGYLDDYAFAQWFVEARRASGTRSSRHIESELYGKGISREIIKEVLSDRSLDREALTALIAKKRSLPREKLLGYLMRKGFSYDQIKSALLPLART